MSVSNSLHVATGSTLPSAGPGPDLFLSEAIHEVMEIIPTVPRLDRLKGALRGSEYGEEGWGDEMRGEESLDQVPLSP